MNSLYNKNNPKALKTRAKRQSVKYLLIFVNRKRLVKTIDH